MWTKDVDENFLIWIKESYIPEVEKHGTLNAPRIAGYLSHREEGSSAILFSGRWKALDYCIAGIMEQGVKLNDELTKIFKDKVIGFPTLMEVIE